MLAVNEAVQQMLDSVEPINEIESLYIADAVDLSLIHI